MAPLRVVDVWEQRNPADPTVGFASELLVGSTPIDTISHVGARPGGVETLTPTQAMDRHWQIIILAGLQDGAQPNLHLRDRILHVGLLADVGAGRVAVGENGREELIDSTRTTRRVVSDNEYRLFIATVTRSRSIVHAGAVRPEDAAPSVFFNPVAYLADTRRENDIAPVDPVEAPLSLPGHIADLWARAANSDEPANVQFVATLLAFMVCEGIASTQPHRWLGAGGTPASAQDYHGQIVLPPSQLERALTYLLRWFLTTIGTNAPSDTAASLDILVHTVVEEHPYGIPEELTEALEACIEELGYNLDTQTDRVVDRHARKIVSNLASYVAGVLGEVTVEQTVSAEVEDVTIRGWMDRPGWVGEGARVTDLRIGKSDCTKASVAESPRLATYQMAMLASGGKVTGVRITLLGGSKPQIYNRPALQGEELERWRELVREVVLSARGPHFEARPSQEICRYCSFDRLCPAHERGRKVVE